MKVVVVAVLGLALIGSGCSADPEGQNTGSADIETGSGVNYDRGGARQDINAIDLDWRKGVTNETQSGTGAPRPEATNKVRSSVAEE